MLKQSDIDRLKEIYHQEFNEEIDNQEAWEMGYRLLNLVKAVYSAQPKKRKETSKK